MEATRLSGDRRKVALRLTSQGARVLKDAPGPVSGVLPDALARIDEATLNRLQKDLDILIKAMGGSRKSAKVPLAHM